MAKPEGRRRARGALSEKLERLVRRAVEPQIAAAETRTAAELRAVTAQLEQLGAHLVATRAIAASAVDEVPALRRLLVEARATEEYAQALDDPDPLVTVRIPTYDRSRLLVERALPSVVAQTHRNLEVIVVGDGCTNDTQERVEAFGDPRVRFVNLPFRYPYPVEPRRRWLVAGSPGMNRGAELARGAWIATLGDDDAYEPDHVECLLERARSGRYEMVYGELLEHRTPPNHDVVHAKYPPEGGAFGVQAAIFMAALRFFDLNVTSWLMDEPGDWNLCRRMLEAGVMIGYVDRVVTHYYPSGSQSDPSSPAPRG